MIDTKEQELEQLYGTNSHVHLLSALEGVDARTAGRRVDGFPHSIHQILGHMIFWQDIALARIEGREYDAGEHAEDGWAFPEGPRDDIDWAASVENLAHGLRRVEAHLEEVGDSEVALRNVRMVQGHNSYHLGQIVTLRRILGSWPPPKGGDTW